MNITVTMSKAMYDLLLNGRKPTVDTIGIKACGTHKKVVEYVDATFGLLGKVEEVVVQ